MCYTEQQAAPNLCGLKQNSGILLGTPEGVEGRNPEWLQRQTAKHIERQSADST